MATCWLLSFLLFWVVFIFSSSFSSSSMTPLSIGDSSIQESRTSREEEKKEKKSSFELVQSTFFDFLIVSSNVANKVITVDYILDQCSETLSTSSLSAQEGGESNHCHNPEQLEILHEILQDLYDDTLENSHQSFPKDISKIISNYSPIDCSHSEVYQKVISCLKIKLKRQEIKGLNFYRKDFANQLYQLLVMISLSIREDDNSTSFKNKEKEEKEEIKEEKESDYFWYNLSRLLFKWMIYTRQNIKDNRELEEMRLKDIELIALMIREKGKINFSSSFSLELVDEPAMSAFNDLMNCEFMENLDIIFLFTFALEDFYGMPNDDNVERCQLLRDKHFNGDFDSNLLLKFMILLHDPFGEMKQCFPDYKYLIRLVPPLNNYFSLPSIRRSQVAIPHGPDSLGICNLRYIGTAIINFFLNTEKRFLISNPQELLILLEKLKEAKLLTIDMLKRIIKFRLPDSDKSYGWSEIIFIELLTEHAGKDIMIVDALFQSYSSLMV